MPLRRGVGLAEENSGAFEERYNNVKAVVVGAAGRTGQAITRQLLQAPNAQVKGLVRDTVAAVSPCINFAGHKSRAVRAL